MSSSLEIISAFSGIAAIRHLTQDSLTWHCDRMARLLNPTQVHYCAIQTISDGQGFVVAKNSDNPDRWYH
jgi:hypothetical protein